MKKLYVLIALSLSSAALQAQTVTISDPNFAAWLTFTYPTCMNGNQLDINCSAITSDTLVVIPNLSIGNITGIEHFTNLKELDVTNNNLTSLPILPQSLLRLRCAQNEIASINMLPNSLVELNCNHNKITSFPLFPNTLEILKFYDNELAAVPTYPTLLKVLHCGGNLYNSLPALPQVLEEFDCQGLGLQSIPTLPGSLKILACPYNELVALPALPSGLTKLQAFNNQLAELPTLPPTLVEMNVGTNNLITLPTLPASITYINCQYNAINNLPALPNQLKYLYCRSNLLASFPFIPNSVRVIDCSYNPIYCLDFVVGWNHNEPAYLYFDNTEVFCRPTYSLNLEPVSLQQYMSYPMCTAGQACEVLSIDENELNVNIQVFPNPMSDIVQIQSNQVLENVELYDMGGRKVIDSRVNATAISLDISYLTTGFYILKSGSYTTKLVKQ